MFGHAYWFRDLSNKAARRVKKLLGRPDPTPWVLRPNSAARRGSRSSAYVDFILALDFLNNNATLTRMFHEALSPYGLSLLVANKTNVAKLTTEIAAGKIRPNVLLDLCSACEPAFGELLKAAAKAGVYTIGEPAKLEQWTYKARAQKKLEDAGLPVPPTVLIRATDKSRDLTADQRQAIGEKCVIKPSWGVAGKGVMANVKPTAENIEKARQFDPKDDYLVQRLIKWEKFGGQRTAYLRGYNVLGCRTLLWWAPETRIYDLVTWDDFRQHDLMPAIDLIDRMARLTGMDYFSSEIAITNAVGQPRFILIDYCNDQCDLNPQSAQADGPPDEWVKWACGRFAEFVWRTRQGIQAPEGHELWLAGAAATMTNTGPRIVSAA